MTSMGWQVQRIAPMQVNLLAIGKCNPCFPVQQQHPFVLFLVVPEVVRRGVAIGDNAFNAHCSMLEQLGEHFLAEVVGEGMKQVHICACGVFQLQGFPQLQPDEVRGIN